MRLERVKARRGCPIDMCAECIVTGSANWYFCTTRKQSAINKSCLGYSSCCSSSGLQQPRCSRGSLEASSSFGLGSHPAPRWQSTRSAGEANETQTLAAQQKKSKYASLPADCRATAGTRYGSQIGVWGTTWHKSVALALTGDDTRGSLLSSLLSQEPLIAHPAPS